MSYNSIIKLLECTCFLYFRNRCTLRDNIFGLRKGDVKVCTKSDNDNIFNQMHFFKKGKTNNNNLQKTIIKNFKQKNFKTLLHIKCDESIE